MNELQFFTDLTASLAWPGVVVLLIVVLASPLRRLVDGLSSVEWSSGKLRISREFREATRSTKEAIDELKEAPRDTAVPSPAAPLSTPLADINPWLVSASQNPAFAVLESWEGLRVAIFDLANRTGVDNGALSKTLQIGLSDTLSALVESRVVNQSFVGAVEDLRALRDKVAHGQSTPSQPEGIAFVTSSWELVRAAKALAIVFDLQGGYSPNRDRRAQKPSR